MKRIRIWNFQKRKVRRRHKYRRNTFLLRHSERAFRKNNQNIYRREIKGRHRARVYSSRRNGQAKAYRACSILHRNFRNRRYRKIYKPFRKQMLLRRMHGLKENSKKPKLYNNVIWLNRGSISFTSTRQFDHFGREVKEPKLSSYEKRDKRFMKRYYAAKEMSYFRAFKRKKKKTFMQKRIVRILRRKRRYKKLRQKRRILLRKLINKHAKRYHERQYN